MFFGLSKLRSRRRTAKEKPQKIKRRKPIPLRTKFPTYENPLKSYRQRFPNQSLIAHAEQCRAKQLANPTPAGDAMAEILRGLGLRFDREVIFYRTGAYIVVDFVVWSPKGKVAIENDGSQHKLQRGYDAGRDQWLLQTHGIPTLRFWNRQVLKYPGAAAMQIRRAVSV